MINYFDLAIKEANKAYKIGEIPVGAIIVLNNKVIAKAHNLKIKKNDITNHAEIVAIKKAARKIGDWRLTECDLYVTLEPCNMCREIIKQSRIKNVYYLINKLEYKKEFNKTNFKKIDINAISTEYKKKLSTFFKLKCKR